MSYSKLAVGIDFSAESEVAAHRAIECARHTGAEVVLVHVGQLVERPVGAPKSMSATVAEFQRLLRAELAKDRRMLEELRERLSGQGPEVSQLISEGIPSEGLVAGASDLGCDLIVVGTHGRTGLRHLLVGSVAERTVRLAEVDVLVARATGDARGGFHKVMVGTDFSEPASRALSRAVELSAPGAEIEVVHCVESVAPGRRLSQGNDVMRELAQAIADEMHKRGDEMIASHSASELTIRFRVEVGSARSVMPALAETGGVDLLCMGSAGERGVRRLMLGSVAESALRRAPCSVLVCHAA